MSPQFSLREEKKIGLLTSTFSNPVRVFLERDVSASVFFFQLAIKPQINCGLNFITHGSVGGVLYEQSPTLKTAIF